jgi:hydrogenase expression/formation protein HypE
MAITLNRLYPGKLEHGFLSSLLHKYTSTDDRIVLGAKVGEDATVIDMGDNYLVAKTDPITFAVDRIGHYAVHVNANDIVCMGATPKWFLATILLPENATRQLAESIFAQIAKVCKQEGIAYCGGHTEVTIGLQRPIVVGQMLGEADKTSLLLKKNAYVGDHIILVQSAPVEATSILATENEELLGQHFSLEFVQKCQNLFIEPGISVRPYAALAMRTAEVHAMHDPTEGGIATAIHELALAADTGVRIVSEKIPLLSEGKLLCDFFELDPLGCIASGSLLLAVPYQSVEPIIKAFDQAGVPASDVGKLVQKSAGKTLVEKDIEHFLPVFEQDEIAKTF